MSGPRQPHGMGGGEWFPGIWKTQGGEAGSERAAKDMHGAGGRVMERSQWREVRSSNNVHTLRPTHWVASYSSFRNQGFLWHHQ